MVNVPCFRMPPFADSTILKEASVRIPRNFIEQGSADRRILLVE